MTHHFFDHDLESLRAMCVEADLPPYTADQAMKWVYEKHVSDPQRMTNLSRRTRAMVADALVFDRGTSIAHQVATDGTQKLLLEWNDPQDAQARSDGRSLPLAPDNRSGKRTETVMIPTEKRRTACISSQVGCPVGCRFCASGIGGLEGNLSAGQIVEQAHRLTRLPEVGRLTNIVFMGMGEPLANYGAVTKAIRTLNAPWGMNIGARRITISTVGLPQAIRRLVAFEIPVTLALSLHAPNDDIRRELIPWAEYASISELLDACNEYFQKTGREITLEYLLLHRVNDQREHALELASVAGKLRANVNLIRYNEVSGMPYGRPETKDVLEFQSVLKQRGINTHIRASRGRDIDAACGQLRHESRSRIAPSS